MKKSARTNHWIAGACGVLLALGGATPAMAWSGYEDWGGSANGDTWIEMNSNLVCRHRARVCINGPVNSGNLRNSENIYIGGTASNSGSPTNTNGTTDSGNTAKGNEADSENNQQKL
ncbi:hypothetical protein AB0D04_00970 [Streptomyces sp. NPDC048483]|uniref:hypothetical protein n=1 Tax=Streptomyces sp. NPDC048483 TaxID=3154927 RepID=UPI0034452BC1